MKRNTNPRNRQLSVRALAICAMFAAMSIVCGKFLAISIGDVIRISFENLPIFLSSLMLGPVVGAVTALCADVFGCILRGYALNPIITVGAVTLGAVSGIMFRALKSLKLAPRVVIGVVIAHLIGSVVIKTFGLASFYAMPFGVLLLWRALNYLIVGALDLIAILLLTKNRYIAGMINSASSLK